LPQHFHNLEVSAYNKLFTHNLNHQKNGKELQRLMNFSGTREKAPLVNIEESD